MNNITITYCAKCRWLLRSTWMAQEILTTFEGQIDELTLLPKTDGIFKVHVNNSLVWCRKEMGGFPDITTLKQKVRDVIAPDMNLGCIDRKK